LVVAHRTHRADLYSRYIPQSSGRLGSGNLIDDRVHRADLYSRYIPQSSGGLSHLRRWNSTSSLQDGCLPTILLQTEDEGGGGESTLASAPASASASALSKKMMSKYLARRSRTVPSVFGKNHNLPIHTQHG
jgi:hypothetical protein